MLTDSKHRNMQQNESSTLNSLTTTFSSPSVPKERRFRQHWAWDFYTYTFATLFGIFAVSCFAIIVRQCKHASNSRNVHRRFTTVQLFVAASLKVVTLLWSPLLLNEASRKTFTTALLIDCCSLALILSAFSILLILLETTKTSLAPPRFQNIWVLLAITAVLTSVILTFNLLVLYKAADREFWSFLSYLTLSAWGTLICIGYIVAGRRMWRNLQSSREVGKSSGERRLKNITILVLLAPFITAVMLSLTICLAAAQYGIFKRLEMSAQASNWSRYGIMFLLKCCQLVIVVLIFGVVIRTKSWTGSVDNAPNVQLGTFVEESPTEENCNDEAPRS